jgi:hypothetical protein
MKIIILFALTMIGMTISCSPKINPSASKAGAADNAFDVNKIDWEIYDTNSSVGMTEIKNENLQGLWLAYKGAFRFEGHVNTMNLFKPLMVEFKDSTLRRTSTSDFQKFTIKNNIFVSRDNDKKDTGIINQITPTQLTITWKRNADYTRYFYKK